MENIISFCKRIIKSNIIKVFSFTAVATVVRMLTGLVSAKVIAVIIGPSGVALLGQLSNFSSIAMTLATGGANNGITKYVSEYKSDKEAIKKILSTAFKITLYCSLLVGFGMIIFHRSLSNYVLLSPSYSYVFIIFGFTVLFYAINMMLISIVNGYQEFRKYATINIWGNIVGLIFSLIFVLTLGLKGALISAVTFQSVSLVITVFMLRRKVWLSKEYFLKRIDRIMFMNLLKYSVGAIIFILLTPIIQLLLRAFVFSRISPTDAGIWEGMNRISGMYMMLITTVLSVYYIPRLSDIHDSVEMNMEIKNAYRLILPLLCIGFCFIYFMRKFVVNFIFTPEFAPMEKLFAWQLLLDTINACSYILSYIMIAKAMIRTYVITTIIFSFLYLFFSFGLLILSDNIIGIIQGNIISQSLYVITMIFIFRNILFLPSIRNGN